MQIVSLLGPKGLGLSVDKSVSKRIVRKMIPLIAQKDFVGILNKLTLMLVIAPTYISVNNLLRNI